NFYWRELGEQFIEDMRRMLSRHGLDDLLKVHWVSNSSSDVSLGPTFFKALEKQMDYAHREAGRIEEARRRDDFEAVRRSILYEMQALLKFYDKEMTLLWPEGVE